MKLYYKSVREDGNGDLGLITSASQEGKTRTSQTLIGIVEKRFLEPNVTHPRKLRKRLSSSRISHEYPGTYRDDGVLFLTSTKPEIHVPFDLMALTVDSNIGGYQPEAEFIEGYQKFIFKEYREMKRAFPNTTRALSELNRFRASFSLNGLDPAKMNYNECLFRGKIEIIPLALIGLGKIHSIAKRLGMPWSVSAKDYINSRRPLPFLEDSGGSTYCPFLDDFD